MTDTGTTTTPSFSSSSSSSTSSTTASSDDEPPRNRRSLLSDALELHTPLLPPLIQITLSYLSLDRLAILDGHTIQLTPLPLTTTHTATHITTPHPLHSHIPLRSAATLIHLHLDGRLCTTGNKDKLVRLHTTLPPSTLPATPATSVLHLRHDRSHHPTVTCFLSLDARRLLIGFDDGSLQVYDTRTGAKVCGLSLDCRIVTLHHTTPAYALTAHSTAMLSPATTTLPDTTLSAPSSPHCTTHVIVYSSDHTYRLVDVQLCRVAKYIGRIGYVHRSFALDGGGGRVAACGEQSVFVWRLYTWTCERTVNREEETKAEQHHHYTHRHYPSEERKEEAAHTTQWQESKEQSSDTASEAAVAVVRQPTFVCPLWSSAFIAVASTSGFVHVWRVGVSWSQLLLCSFMAHDGGVMRVHYARDGRLVTSGHDGRVRVWQLSCADSQWKWRQQRAGSERLSVEEELEDAERWHVRLVMVYDVMVQDTRQWNGSVLFLPGD